MYDDDYGTCAKTYAALLIYPVRTDPETITERLGIEPSHWQRKGGPIAGSLRRPPRIAEIDLWSLSTEGHVESRDSRRHIDWLLDRIEGKAAELRSLQDEGGRICVSCFWLSLSGQGGPTISPGQMRRLGALNIELWFDVYFVGEDEPARP
jgi:Domain of unknown function (DUF4279)